MKPRRLSSILILPVALAVGCATQPRPPATGAPTTPATAGARTPDAVLADAIAATGGAATWRTHKSAHLKLTIAFQGMAMGGPAEHFQTNTNKSLTVTTLPGVGRISEGTNGKIFWSQDPVNGIRFLEGAEAEQARIEACWNADLEAHDLYPKIDLAPDSPAGLECLLMTPKIGAPLRNCYDRQTHLQVSQEGIHPTAQGDVPFRSRVSDWRTVGGVKLAFSSETQAGPITILTTINDAAFDEPMDDKMFDPPATPAAK